jgi:hypothetical protein
MKIVDPLNPPSEAHSNPPERTAQVLRYQGVTLRDIAPEVVLRAALDKDLKAVVLIGLLADGSEYFCSSFGDEADVVWLMERAKLALMGVISLVESDA